MVRATFTIAWYTLLEALRTRLLLLTFAFAGAGALLARFLERVAIADAEAIRTGVMAAQFRLTAVVLIAAFVTVSHVREANDKGLELLLSFPLPRYVYLFGRLAGHLACAAWLALLFSLPLLPFAPFGPWLAWAVSLWLELSLVATASLFCVITLNQITAALAAVLAFYAFARTLPALQLIAGSQLAFDGSPATRAMARVLDGIAYLTPRIDLFTRAPWLIDAPPTVGDLATVAAQAGLYGLLLCAASLFDLHRKNL